MTEFKTRELATKLTGKVLEPADEGYDAARALWNARFDRRPAVIARCQTTEDVQAAVDFARTHDLQLSVKGGGHAFAANTVGEGGLLIDLSPMKGIEVDPESKTARIQPGLKWGEVDPVTQKHGLSPVGGTVSTVGVAGFILGGGSGYLSRQHGMAVDNLLSVDVVTADGRLVHASEDENPDLFWALRGGSGNFGVVTSFEVRLHEVGPEILTGQIVHRFEDAAAVLRLYRDFMRDAPDEVQCYPFIFHAPPIPEFPAEFHGEIVIDLVVFHSDPGAKEVFQPLLDFGNPILAFVAPQSYIENQKAFDAGLPAGHRWESRAHQLTALSDELIETVIANVGELPGDFTSAYFDAAGGAIARVDPSATAYPQREAPCAFHIMAGWISPDRDDEITSWTQAFHDALTPFSTGGVYVNVLGTGEEARVRAAYGPNYDRLVELKRKWDPNNRFRMNHNIEP
jgi:FAD/FMN-containing dehydrogenase